VTELVEKDDDGQDKQKGNDIADEKMAQIIETVQKKLDHPIPLVQSQRPRPRTL
jgi:uncharacterized metal-binding protein